MDDDLARRLRLLRESLDSPTTPTLPKTLTPVRSPADGSDDDDALAARFARLCSPEATVISAAPYSSKELSIEELVLALASDASPWTTGPSADDDEAEIEALLVEARATLTPSADPPRAESEKTVEVTAEDTADDGVSDAGRSDPDMEAEILQRVRDEIEFEAKHGLGQPEVEEEEEEEPVRTKDGEEPSSEESLSARFAALGGLELPTVPRFNPSVKKPAVPAVVDETESWCCICNEDAEFRCSGCENDLYCESCLYEAHIGPAAGYDERRHKWGRYVKPKVLAQ